MKQTPTIDFKAIMSKPLSVAGVRKIKTLTPEHIRKLVRDHHPAVQYVQQHTSALVK